MSNPHGMPLPGLRMRQALFTLFLLFTPALIGAQSLSDRALLARLDAAIPPGALPAVDRGGDAVARQIQGALTNFARYVREDDRRAAEKSLFDLDQASVRRRTWGWPHYAMARVFFRLHERDARALVSDGKVDGESNLDAAWRHLDAALERDPQLVPARSLTVDLAYRGGDRELPKPMRRAVEREVYGSNTPVRAWVVYGRALRTEQRYDSARVVFEHAALMGSDYAVLRLELARTFIALGDTTAAITAYWDGASEMTPAGRALYRQDLEWIVSDDSLAGFAATTDEEVAGWLRKFWGERDAAALNPEHGRLTEHLRRWVVAHRDFRVPQPWKRAIYTRFWNIAGGALCVANASRLMDSLPLHSPTIDGDPRHREPLLDHRGFIYLRHGEPLTRTMAATFGDTTLDADAITSVYLGSWVYWIEGEWRAFHFTGSDVFGTHAPTTLRSYLPFNFGAWMALAQILPGFQAAALMLDPGRASRTPKSCLTPIQVAVRKHRADVSVGITNDSDSPVITRPWNAPVRFFALGTASDGTSRALITFAVPGRDLVAEPAENGAVQYPVEFRILAYEVASGRTIAMDTVRLFRSPHPLGENQFLTGWFEVRLGAGTWQVSVRAQQDDDEGGTYALRRGLVLDAGGGLALSDVVTGLPGSPEGWIAGGQAFPLNTLGAWRVGADVELYYEVRGLSLGHPYTTTLQVLPGEARLKQQVGLRTQDVATGTLTPIRRTLGLGTLKPGSYRVVVTVEAAGVRVVREQVILVVE